MIRREKPCVQSGETLPEFDHMDAGATVSMSLEKRQGMPWAPCFLRGNPYLPPNCTNLILAVGLWAMSQKRTMSHTHVSSSITLAKGAVF